MKNFKDYPQDLQKIVELTPDGWPKSDANSVHLYCEKPFFSMAYCILDHEHHRTDYEACRAAYLHETAGDIKAGEVDWRQLCVDMVEAIEHGSLGQVDDAMKAAKAALEATK